MFGKIFLKALRDTFFAICGLWSGDGQGDSTFLLGVISNRRRKLKLLILQGDPQFHPLAWYPNLPFRKTLSRVLGLLTAMIFKKVSESVFFQGFLYKFTACKVKYKKGVANSLMAFNLLKRLSMHFKIKSIQGASET